jgi:N-acyl-D-aspartate/D-glutamate deacylase
MADLVLRGGTVIDGTGAPGVRADVAIERDRIAAIGTGLSGARTLDASGCVVAPGFVDIHTHYDAQVFWDPALTPSCFHGVTTVVAGNCGFSTAPTRPAHREVIARTLENVEDMNPASLAAGVPWDFETHPQYLASVGRRGTALNFGAYVGHTAVRLYAVLSLEEAVRKLTSEPAQLFRFTDRGMLRPGAFADVAVFDPQTVAPGPLRRVRDFPGDADRLTADAPEGMRHVLVNGVPIRADGEALRDARPGRLVAQGSLA